VNYVVALYDFSAQADGDLEFKAGDRIEVVERTESAEDWWTGRLDGRTGVFPGECETPQERVDSTDVGKELQVDPGCCLLGPGHGTSTIG